MLPPHCRRVDRRRRRTTPPGGGGHCPALPCPALPTQSCPWVAAAGASSARAQRSAPACASPACVAQTLMTCARTGRGHGHGDAGCAGRSVPRGGRRAFDAAHAAHLHDPAQLWGGGHGSLDLDLGRITALIGPTGSGKSTVLRALLVLRAALAGGRGAGGAAAYDGGLRDMAAGGGGARRMRIGASGQKVTGMDGSPDVATDFRTARNLAARGVPTRSMPQ